LKKPVFTPVFLWALVLPFEIKMYTGSSFWRLLIIMQSPPISLRKTALYEVLMPYIGLTLFLCNLIYYVYNYFG